MTIKHGMKYDFKIALLAKTVFDMFRTYPRHMPDNFYVHARSETNQ